MTVLHTPLRLGSATVRNRLYRAPVLEGAGSGDDAADRYAKHFVENARHGVGMIIQGNSCITEEGRTLARHDARQHPRAHAADGADGRRRPRRGRRPIVIQIGHGGLYAMEAWHEPYASQRKGPLLAPVPAPPRSCGPPSPACPCTP